MTAFKSHIVMSVFMHATVVATAMVFAVWDAASDIHKNYVAVALVEYGIEKKPALGEKKENTRKNNRAAPRGPEPNSAKVSLPAADREEIASPALHEEGQLKESAFTAKENPLFGGGITQAIQGAVGQRSSPGVTLIPLSVGAVSHGDRNGSGGEANGGDPGTVAAIRSAIERVKNYPALARRRGIEGTVIAGFRINSKGLPEGITITRSSGYALLDNAAKETIMKAAPLPSVKDSIEIPITFRLKKED